MPEMRGFNGHAIADWAQQTFDDIAALNGGARKLMRVICRWDHFQPSSGSGGISSSAITALDHTLERAEAAGIYCMLDFHIMQGAYPAWEQTSGTDHEGNYATNGQVLTQYLANRYGNPSSPQYALNCVGFGLNEPSVADATTRNGNNAIPYLENLQRTMIGWLRAYAPDWIGFVAYGWAAQTPLRVTGTNPSMTEADPNAYDAVGGNVVIDLHDYVMDDDAGTDGRQYNGMLYPVTQGGHEYGTGDEGAYLPAQYKRDLFFAYIAPYKAFSIAADIPIMLGEYGWPVVGVGGFTAGETLWINDKQVAWDDAGFVARCAWAYNVAPYYEDNFTLRQGGAWRPAILDEVGGIPGPLLADDLGGGAVAAIASRSGWATLSGYTGWQVSAAGEAWSSSAEAWSYLIGAPATVEYEVAAQFRVASLASCRRGIVVGMSTTQRTGYALTMDSNGDLRWWRIVNGTATQLGTVNRGALAVNDTFWLTLSRSSAGWIQPFHNDFNLHNDLQDTNITAQGRAGIYGTTSQTATTGIVLTDIRVSDVVLDGA